MMRSGPEKTSPQPEVLTFSIDHTAQRASDPGAAMAGSIRLPGFVVLAPSNSAAVAYVTADLKMDFSDDSVVAVIKENEAFVRDIIYGTIRSELMTRDIADINEINLELAIRKALGQFVAREMIERIAFERFSLV
jgi:flagellar basal body-associated protein FliL